MHLADAFIQSDLQGIQAIHFWQYVLFLKNCFETIFVKNTFQVNLNWIKNMYCQVCTSNIISELKWCA